MPPAKLGTASSISLGESRPSGYAIGLTTVIRFDRWYDCSLSDAKLHCCLCETEMATGGFKRAQTVERWKVIVQRTPMH